MKLVKGTARKDRTNPNEPEASSDQPVPPALLNEDETRYFDHIVELLEEQGYASKSHTDVIALCARRLAEVDMYSATINHFGASYETFTNAGGRMVRMRPEIAARSEAARHAHGLLAELGLSPASMSKVSATPGAKKKTANPFGQIG